MEIGPDTETAKSILVAPLARYYQLGFYYLADMNSDYNKNKEHMSQSESATFQELLNNNQIALDNIIAQIDRIQAWTPNTTGYATDGLSSEIFRCE
jgi:hypothetical protein